MRALPAADLPVEHRCGADPFFQPSRSLDIVRGVNVNRRPVGIILLIIFFAAGALICSLVMLALAFPGGALDPIWRLRPDAHEEFQEFGVWSIALMAAVGAGCGLAAFGLGRGAEWGRRLAVGVLTVNLVGDAFNAVFRHDLRTLIGLPIGGLMIWYLMKQPPATR